MSTLLAALACGLVIIATPSGAAEPKFVQKALSFRAPDGTVLHASVGGFGSLEPRPVIVEDSPYSPDVSTLS
ncbi:MAG TPA: hypothetical protein VHE57_02945, partial [Mycobacteriales bacterium]|nr:hypothetical protein [Mycobacteriales bacterium]